MQPLPREFLRKLSFRERLGQRSLKISLNLVQVLALGVTSRASRPVRPSTANLASEREGVGRLHSPSAQKMFLWSIRARPWALWLGLNRAESLLGTRMLSLERIWLCQQRIALNEPVIKFISKILWVYILLPYHFLLIRLSTFASIS